MNQNWFMDSEAMNQNWFMVSGAMHQDALDSSPGEFNVPPPERSDSSSGSDADFFEELMSVLLIRDIPHSRPANEHQQGHWCYPRRSSY